MLGMALHGFHGLVAPFYPFKRPGYKSVEVNPEASIDGPEAHPFYAFWNLLKRTQKGTDRRVIAQCVPVIHFVGAAKHLIYGVGAPVGLRVKLLRNLECFSRAPDYPPSLEDQRIHQPRGHTSGTAVWKAIKHGHVGASRSTSRHGNTRNPGAYYRHAQRTIHRF